MTIYSKYFTEITKGVACKHFIHPEDMSCWAALWNHSLKVFSTNMRLFVPIAFVNFRAKSVKL
jgi:hypothetical protein